MAIPKRVGSSGPRPWEIRKQKEAQRKAELANRSKKNAQRKKPQRPGVSSGTAANMRDRVDKLVFERGISANEAKRILGIKHTAAQAKKK